MEVILAEKAGFCFGVMRALDIISKVRRSTNLPIYTLGPIIHNPQVVEKLKKDGIIPIENLDDVEGKGYLVIRSHGVSPEVIEEAERRGFKLIDATCPYVKRVQEYAKMLVNEGYRVVIVGEENHPEVKGILGHTGDRAEIYSCEMDVKQREKIGVVAQTTQSFTNLKEAIDHLLERAGELRVFNTICSATHERQEAAKELAQKVDVMIVIGGKNSANTTRLARISRTICPRTYHIETAEEIQPEWFEAANRVGITAGASTPDWIIDAVYQKIIGLQEVR